MSRWKKTEFVEPGSALSSDSAVRRVSIKRTEPSHRDLERLVERVSELNAKLKAQSQELQRARSELQGSRDRYSFGLRSAEEKRRSSEAGSHAILDTVADAIVSSDARGRIQLFNKASERLFGYSQAEVLGKNVRTLMPDPHRLEHDGYLQHYLMTGERRIIDGTPREVIGMRKDGTTFPLELWIGEWWDRGERKFVGVMRDITERKRSETQLRESEERFRQIAEYVEDVFIVQERGSQRVLYANPAFQTIFGRPVSEVDLSAGGWLDAIELVDRKVVLSAYQSFVQGTPLDEECRIRRPDGTVRWIRLRMFPILVRDGIVRRELCVIQDVTPLHELRQAQKFEAVGALASSVAHDFNNVLQAVLGCVRMALDDKTSPERARQYLERAANAVRTGGELAGQLTAFARKQPTCPRPVAIDAFVRNASRLLERLLTEQISLQIDTGAEGYAVFADPVQIEQILLNLAANARDAMPEGGTFSIRSDVIWRDAEEAKRYGLDKAERYVRLTVEDSGMGMDEHTRARLFEPFFTTKALGKGTGLGLATVLAVTRQLGGSVDVQSEPGRGTRFTFHFPCSKQPPERPSQLVRVATRLSGTALVVEDESLIRVTVRHYLEQLGLTVFDAENADEALRLCESRHGSVELLVSDLALPGENGSKLVARIKQRCPTVRVLFMSANPELLAGEERAGNATRVLRKPFDKEELATEVSALFKTAGTNLKIDSRARSEGETILLVEDDPVARITLTDLLSTSGYRVQAFARPSQALAATRNREPIDLLLSDVRLPEMDGSQLALELRRSRPELRVVFMSGLSEAPEGASAFVQKPIDLDDLLEALERTLAG